MNKMPAFSNKSKVCIICEGKEEYEYLKKLISLDVWSDKYSFVLEDAKGNGNIPARYQNNYQIGTYDVVLVFCDTEKKPWQQYQDIKRKINEFHGVEEAADFVMIYGNPCTMQIVLCHWKDDVYLKKAYKPANEKIIEECTGVKGYRGHEEQIKQIMELINEENYKEMYHRVNKLPKDDSVVGSSNFATFLDYFMSDDESWMEQINKVIE